MLNEQIKTFQQKTNKGAKIMAILAEKIELKNKILSMYDGQIAELEAEGEVIKATKIRIKRCDVMESLIENEVSLDIKKRIQAEDEEALKRFTDEADMLQKEIDEGLFETYIEELKDFVARTRAKDKKADFSRFTDLFEKAAKPLNSTAKVDLYRDIRVLHSKLQK